jgi:glucosamine-phosphate N-acetyltransferase
MEGASNANMSRNIETEEKEKENYVIRRLEASDYAKGFLELLEQLSASGHVVTEEQFLDRLREVEDLGGDHHISVIEDADSGRIVATGSVFLEKKFLRACGKVGHVEDVVVHSSVRGKHLGQKIVRFLTDYAKLAGCYKVILDCSVENKGFYQKCGFDEKNVQMALYFH